MDDDLSTAAAERKLNELLQDPEQCGVWSRYHLIGDVIGDRAGPVAAGDLAQRVRQALKDEPTVLAPRRGRLRPLTKTVGGLAIAASVAVMAVLGLRSVRQDAIDLQAPQMASLPIANYLASAPRVSPHISTVSSTQAPFYQPLQGTRWDAKQPEVIYRLNDYLRDHSVVAARDGVQGPLSYRRITNPGGSYPGNKE